MSDESLVAEFGLEVAAGTAVFRQGDPGGSIYVVRSGKVSVVKEVNGKQRIVATLGPGEFFGEMAVVSGNPRSATVRVIEDAKLLKIPSDRFEQIVMRGGEIAVRLIRCLTERLDAANRLVDVLVESDASARVLLDIRRTVSESGAGAALDPEEIGLRLALDGFGVDKALRRLLRVGVLDDSGGSIRVRDPSRLDAFLEFVRAESALQ